MFNSLKIYTVHIRPEQHAPFENPVFVGEGFNFYAFIFTWMWALYNRLWLPAVLIILFNVMLGGMADKFGFEHISIVAMQFGFQILVGYQANDMLRRGLKKKGYITTDLVTGDSLMRAEQRFFERNAEHILART